jgi:hypothetical protein
MVASTLTSDDPWSKAGSPREGGDVSGTSTYGYERRAHLEALAAQLPSHGLAGRLLNQEDPVLWVWHPRTRRQTIVLATPTQDGWVFLWSPEGRERAGEPAATADAIGWLLSGSG